MNVQSINEDGAGASRDTGPASKEVVECELTQQPALQAGHSLKLSTGLFFYAHASIKEKKRKHKAYPAN